MTKYKVDVNSDGDHAGARHVDDHHAGSSAGEVTEQAAPRVDDDITDKAVTIGVVVVGAALFEAALIPGILLGAAAVFAPKYFPEIGERVQPLFNGTVRGAYKLGRRARAAVGEAQERMNDIAAEVHAEEATAAEPAEAKAERVPA